MRTHRYVDHRQVTLHTRKTSKTEYNINIHLTDLYTALCKAKCIKCTCTHYSNSSLFTHSELEQRSCLIANFYLPVVYRNDILEDLNVQE